MDASKDEDIVAKFGKWNDMKEDEKVKCIELDSKSEEYKKVEVKFTVTVKNAVIISITRIQNVYLYWQYAVRKQAMKQQYLCGNEEIISWN